MPIDPNDPSPRAGARAGREATTERGTRGSFIRLRVERLEARLLMTRRPDLEPTWQASLSGLCGCSICSGLAQATIPDTASPTTAAGNLSSLASLPQLNSLPNARTTLFLDFDGFRIDRWGDYSNVSAGVFDRDGDPATFSETELQSIREIWARTAEDYSPFQINVTTVDPGYEADRTTARIVVGGHWRDWFGESAGGIAYVGGFYNSAPNVGFAFEDALGNGNPRYVAEAVSHEAGHLFGLQHQSLWSNGSMTSSYSTGSSLWAPIMGVGYYAQRTTWALGATDAGVSARQDDMEILANGSSQLGYRADEAGGSGGTAVLLRATPDSAGASTASFSTSGLIGRTLDEDWYAFAASAGPVSLDLQVASQGANLDGILELRNQAGRVLATAAPGDRLGATLNASVSDGWYYAVVRGGTDYGNTGSYTLRGSLTAPKRTEPAASESRITTPAVSPGELDLFMGSVALTTERPISFGYTPTGRAVDRVITIRNTGQGTLQLESLDTSGLPASFKLVGNPPSGPLAPGRTTSFRIRLLSQSAGSQTGQLRIHSNDRDEGQRIVRLEGTATPSPLMIDDGGPGFQSSGTWNALRSGRGRNSLVAATGAGEASATWTASELIPGQYRVYASWTASPMLATDTPFTLLDGTQVLATVRINQEQPPASFSASGSFWSPLSTVSVAGNQLQVKLTNAANDRVAADAIRVEWLGPNVESGLLNKIAAEAIVPRIGNQLVAAAMRPPGGQTFRDTIGDRECLPYARFPDTLPAKAAGSVRALELPATHATPASPLVDIRATARHEAGVDGAVAGPLDWLSPLPELT